MNWAIVDASGILKLLYYYLKYRNEQGIVRNLTTTHILDRITPALGNQPLRCP